MRPVLEVEDITKVFVTEGKPDFTAVSHVSFQLYQGEVLGIVGESGSGKSTLAKIIARLTDATEGRILLENRDITRAKGKKLREAYGEIQMVFQNPASSFDPRKTLGNGIGESLRNHGVSKIETRERVLELLEQCGLPKEFYERYPHEVSGGQCQRAAIARALAVKPKMVICDEATSALDVTVQQKEFYERYPHEVSGGQCQRAAIARALAVKPKMVICDEATSALDVTVQQQVIYGVTEKLERREKSFVPFYLP